MYFYIIIFLTFFLTTDTFSQVDSLLTDTVVIQKDPVVIKQKVLIEEVAVVKPPPEKPWLAGLYIRAGEVKRSEKGVSSSDPAFNAGLEIKKRFKVISLESGVAYLRTVSKAVDRVAGKYTVFEREIIKDTINCATTITPDGIRTVCNTHDSVVVVARTKESVSELERKEVNQFVQFPLLISIDFYNRRFYANIGTGVLLNILMNKNIKIDNKTVFWSSQLHIGFRFSNKITAEAKAQYARNIASLLDSGTGSWKLSGGGLGVQYHF